MFPDESRYDNEYADYFDAEVKPIFSIDEQLDMVSTTYSELADRIHQTMIPIIKSLVDTMLSIIREFNNTYSNKRILYLATHGKHRVRKKNRNRILKWCEREAKKNGQR